MIKVIADTNILINLYGAFLHKGQKVKSLKSYSQFLNLIDTNVIHVYATNEIMNEFSYAKGNTTTTQHNFDTFISKYVKKINFTDEENKLIENLAVALSNQKITYINEYDVKMQDRVLFEQANKQGDKNYIDKCIMASSIVAKLPLITINEKDFYGHKYTKPILDKLKIKYSPKVISVHELLDLTKNNEFSL